jgi:hypothetical protein
LKSELIWGNEDLLLLLLLALFVIEVTTAVIPLLFLVAPHFLDAFDEFELCE